MKPIKTINQQIDQLEYIGDMVRQLARMASEDNQNLLTYISTRQRLRLKTKSALSAARWHRMIPVQIIDTTPPAPRSIRPANSSSNRAA